MANQIVKIFRQDKSSKLEAQINDFLSSHSSYSIHTLSICYSEDFEVYVAMVVFNTNTNGQNS